MTRSAPALRDPKTNSGLRALPTGVRLAAAGFGETFRHRDLFRLSLLPVAINLALFAGFVVAGLWAYDALAGAIALDIDESSFWHALNTVWHVIVSVVLVFLIFVVGAVLSVVIGGVLAGPIYERMSERYESHLVGRALDERFRLKTFVKTFSRDLTAQLSLLALYGLGLVATLLVQLVPVVGQVVGSALSLAWSWLFLSVEFMTPALSRHELGFGQRLGVVTRNLWVSLGFGIGAWGILLLPLTMPFLVVSGTRLYLGLAAYGHAPSRLSDDDRQQLTATP